MVENILSDNKKNYIVVKLNSNNRDEALKILGEKLFEAGYVKESYIEAVLAREEIYPTGLPMQGVGIAIPHTDSIHVNKKAIVVGILEKSIVFQVMGSVDEFVNVELVFMLAIKEPQAQLEMLQGLIETCQQEEVLYTLRDCKDLVAVKEIIDNLL